MGVAEARLRAAAGTLRSDVVAGELSGALQGSGIPCLLLRGPALERAVGPRTYGDVDLLVPSAHIEGAERVLAELGFGAATTRADFPLRGEPHANEWVRGSDGASVDLHRTVSGAGVDPDVVWGTLNEDAEELSLPGARIRCPAQAGLALLVALHAAHHGPHVAKPLRDLDAALERLPAACWGEAAALAVCLRAQAAFAAGMRLRPRGAALAHELALADAAPAHVALRAGGAPPPALGLLGVLETPGLVPKARLLLRGLVPSPAALRLGRRLAQRGRLGLAAAYATHPFWLLRHLGPSAAAVRRARRGGR